MKFIYTSTIVSLALLLTQAIAVPIAEPEAELDERGFPKWPKLPGLGGSDCPTAPVQQTNQCSTGTPFCCSPENGGHNCVKSQVSCDQTVICCNNNFGFQVCMGDIDFNMPININIDIDL